MATDTPLDMSARCGEARPPVVDEPRPDGASLAFLMEEIFAGAYRANEKSVKGEGVNQALPAGGPAR